MPHEPQAGGLVFDSFGSAFVVLSLQTLQSPKWRVRPLRSLTLTLSLSRFVPDLQPPLHALGREGLMGLLNQS
jgi:hypothetical protein